MKKNETTMKQDTPQARIMARRKELRLSQGDVGEKIGTSGQYIGLLERGKRNLTDDLIISLSEVLRVSTEYIRTGSEKKALYDYSDLIDKEKSDISYLAALTMVTSITFSFTCWINSKKKSISVPLEHMVQYSLHDVICHVNYEGKITQGIIISVYVESVDGITQLSPLQFWKAIDQIIDYSESILWDIGKTKSSTERRIAQYEESLHMAELLTDIDNSHEEIAKMRAEIEKEMYFESLKFSPNSHHQKDT